MIKYVEGDILLTSAAAIAHGVAPGDHLETGLALALRERWPAMAKDFRHHCHTTHPKPGELFAWAGAGGVRIVNLLTQEPAEGHHGHAHPGKAKLEHVNHALRGLRKLLEDESIATLALPRLATGVGGLAWDEVKHLIEKHLGDVAARVYVYETYKAGVKAREA